MTKQEGVKDTYREPPALARFRPRDEYVSTFDMLHDTARNQAYREAIRLQATLVPEDNGRIGDCRTLATPLRWLDIGTGSGLLACLVAASYCPPPKGKQASSGPNAAPSATETTMEVFACEGVSEVADVAAETFEKNHGGIHLFRGRSTEMQVGRDLPSRIPRVISELLGTSLLEEGILPTLRDARDRLLSPGYVSIPHSAEVWAFCCESSELHSMSRLLRPAANGGSGGGILPPSTEKWERCPGTPSPALVRARYRPLSPSVRIFDFEFASSLHPLPRPEGRQREVVFPVGDGVSGTVHAVVCWWRCFMDEGRTIVMSTSPSPMESTNNHGALPEEGRASTAPPLRDHWRQSVYLLSAPVDVLAGDTIRALVCHDDTSIWFHAVEHAAQSAGSKQQAAYSTAASAGGAYASDGTGDGRGTAAEGAKQAATREREGSASGSEGGSTGPTRRETGERGHIPVEDVDRARGRNAGLSPPACVCGLHRTCPLSRIWMLNDRDRTAAFRSAIRSAIVVSGISFSGRRYRDVTGAEASQQKTVTATTAASAPAVASGPGIKKRRTTAPAARVACLSDGFLLPLLAAQEGASEVFEIQPSAAYAAVCRDVYHANGIDVGVGGVDIRGNTDTNEDDDDSDGDKQGRRIIRPFPGGVSDVYELLMPPQGSAYADNNDTGGFGWAGERKLDAVLGEPYFESLSAAAWALEPLLLFWCARTALEAGGCFSPRTRVVPARARLLACPFACDLLFRGRRPVGIVEGVDMSAVNDTLGHGYPVKRKGGSRRSSSGGEGGEGAEAEDGARRSGGYIESARLSEYCHELLGPSIVVLDMDLTRPLCDLRGGRKEIHCRKAGRQSATTTGGEGVAESASSPPRQPGQQEEAAHGECHGVALWLDFWLDEEGSQRLSTGPEVLYWPQGLMFFDEGWVVPPCGGSFHLEFSLEDGALGVSVE